MIIDYDGLRWIAMDYDRLQWITMDYDGLQRTMVGYGISHSKCAMEYDGLYIPRDYRLRCITMGYYELRGF